VIVTITGAVNVGGVKYLMEDKVEIPDPSPLAEEVNEHERHALDLDSAESHADRLRD
jgi:hypothetical protein